MTVLRPSLRFLLLHPYHFLALGLGSGLAPRGPGTFGTLAAWLLYAPLRDGLSDAGMALFLLAGLALGSLAIAHTGPALGAIDHGSIVWDEMVAFWLVLWLAPPSLAWQTAAFVLFRAFDIAKPWPIRQADARFKSGFGVMFDDLLAAGYTLLLLAIAWRQLN